MQKVNKDLTPSIVAVIDHGREASGGTHHATRAQGPHSFHRGSHRPWKRSDWRHSSCYKCTRTSLFPSRQSSTMEEKRLEPLIMLHVHKDLTPSIAAVIDLGREATGDTHHATSAQGSHSFHRGSHRPWKRSDWRHSSCYKCTRTPLLPTRQSSTMEEKRLEALLMLQVHKDLTPSNAAVIDHGREATGGTPHATRAQGPNSFHHGSHRPWRRSDWRHSSCYKCTRTSLLPSRQSSTMEEKRLEALLMLQVHKDLTPSIAAIIDHGREATWRHSSCYKCKRTPLLPSRQSSTMEEKRLEALLVLQVHKDPTPSIAAVINHGREATGGTPHATSAQGPHSFHRGSHRPWKRSDWRHSSCYKCTRTSLFPSRQSSTMEEKRLEPLIMLHVHKDLTPSIAAVIDLGREATGDTPHATSAQGPHSFQRGSHRPWKRSDWRHSSCYKCTRIPLLPSRQSSTREEKRLEALLMLHVHKDLTPSIAAVIDHGSEATGGTPHATSAQGPHSFQRGSHRPWKRSDWRHSSCYKCTRTSLLPSRQSSTMEEKRLGALLMLHVHEDLTPSIAAVIDHGGEGTGGTPHAKSAQGPHSFHRGSHRPWKRSVWRHSSCYKCTRTSLLPSRQSSTMEEKRLEALLMLQVHKDLTPSIAAIIDHRREATWRRSSCYKCTRTPLLPSRQSSTMEEKRLEALLVLQVHKDPTPSIAAVINHGREATGGTPHATSAQGPHSFHRGSHRPWKRSDWRHSSCYKCTRTSLFPSRQSSTMEEKRLEALLMLQVHKDLTPSIAAVIDHGREATGGTPHATRARGPNSFHRGSHRPWRRRDWRHSSCKKCTRTSLLPSWQSSTMEEKRLEALLMLHVHEDLTPSIAAVIDHGGEGTGGTPRAKSAQGPHSFHRGSHRPWKRSVWRHSSCYKCTRTSLLQSRQSSTMVEEKRLEALIMLQVHKDLTLSIAAVIDHGKEATGGTPYATGAQGPHSFHLGSHRPWNRSDWRHCSCYKYTRTSLLPSRQSSTMEEKRLEALLMLHVHKDLTPSIAAVIDHGGEATGGTPHATSAQGHHSFHRGSHRPWKKSVWRHSSCYKCTRTSLLPSRQSSTIEEKRPGGTPHATSAQGPHSFHRGSHRPWKRSDWRHSSCYKCTRTPLLPSRQSSTMEEKRLEALLMLQVHKDLTPSIAAVIDHGREATGGTPHATSAQGPHTFNRGSHRPWKRSDWRHSSCYTCTRTSLLPSRQSSTREEKRLETLIMLQVHKYPTPSIAAVIDQGREATGGTPHATRAQGPNSFHRGSHRPWKRSDWRHSSCYKCTRTPLLPTPQSSTMEEKRLEALLMLQVHKYLTPSIAAVIDHGREATGGTPHATRARGPNSFHRGSHRPWRRRDWRHSSCKK